MASKVARKYASPINFGESFLFQEGIGFAEMTAAKKTAVRRKRGRVRTHQDFMFLSVDERSFFLRISAPQKKNDIRFFSRQFLNDGVGKNFPPLILVRPRRGSPYRKRSIEQQYALFCPSFQVAGLGNGLACVALNFLKNIFQGRRKGNSAAHGKT